MKILHENSLSTQRLPKSQTWLFNGHLPPSKLNIKLKTHSLNLLNNPLETLVGMNGIPSSFGNHRQRTMAGSVDSISEIPHQSTNENLSGLSSTQPLLNIVSSNEEGSSIQLQRPSMVKPRLRMSTSFLSATSLNDSVARLRRTGCARHARQPSSLQAIDQITQRKHRSSVIRKFDFSLPLMFSLTVSIQQRSWTDSQILFS